MTHLCSRTIGITAFLLALLILPAGAQAHGGWQKIVEGNYVVTLSPVPLSLIAGEEQKYLLAFSDLQGNPISGNVSADVRVTSDDGLISDQKNLVAENGVLSFSQTYEKPGVYELFVAFRVPGDAKTHEAEDFFIQARENTARSPAPAVQGTPPLIMIGAVLIGLVAAFGIKQALMYKR